MCMASPSIMNAMTRPPHGNVCLGVVTVLSWFAVAVLAIGSSTTSFGGHVTCTFQSDGLTRVKNTGDTGVLEIPCSLASFAGRDSVPRVDVVVPRGSRELRFGCELPAGAASGRAVLVRRGQCTFATKAEQAAIAGASALLIINDDNQVPVVGGRPAVPIDFPVVLLPSSQGRALRKAAVHTGATGTITVVQPPGIAAWRLGQLLSPRACSGKERLVVLAIGATEVLCAPSACTTPVHHVADTGEAIRYLRRHTLHPDIVVVLRPSSGQHVHLLAASGSTLTQAFCGQDAAITFATSTACDGCDNATSAAFAADASPVARSTGVFPSGQAFTTYANIALALLEAEAAGADVVGVLATFTNVTAVDVWGDLLANARGQSLPYPPQVSAEATIHAQGDVAAGDGAGGDGTPRYVVPWTGAMPSIVVNALQPGDIGGWRLAQSDTSAPTAPEMPLSNTTTSAAQCSAAFRRVGVPVRLSPNDNTGNASKPRVAIPSLHPLLQAEALAHRASVVIGDDDVLDAADAQRRLPHMLAGDAVFVPTHLVPWFFTSLAGYIHQPYILLSGSSDRTTPGALMHDVSKWSDHASQDPRLMAWWGMGLPQALVEAFPSIRIQSLPHGMLQLNKSAALPEALQAIATAPPPGHANRTTLLCVDGSDAGTQLGTRVARASGDDLVARVQSEAGMDRLRQLANCAFVLGGAAGGDDVGLDWDGIAMGAIPLRLVQSQQRLPSSAFGDAVTYNVVSLSSLTTGELMAFKDGIDAEPRLHSSPIFSARWLRDIGTVACAARRKTGTASQPLWESSWAAVAPHEQSRVAVYFPGRTPMAASCARLMDAGILDGAPITTRKVYRRCAQAHATNPELLAIVGNAAFAERQFSEAARWWELAAQHLLASGAHARRLNMIQRRLAHVNPSATRDAARQLAKQSLQTKAVRPNARFALPLVFAHTTAQLPWYFADTLAQAHCANPSSSVIVATPHDAWVAFTASAEWRANKLEGAEGVWLTHVATEALAESSAMYDLFRDTAPYANSTESVQMEEHASVERLFVLEALFDVGIVKPTQPILFVGADVLLYEDFSQYSKALAEVKAGLHVSWVNTSLTSASLMYVRSHPHLLVLVEWLSSRLQLSRKALSTLRGSKSMHADVQLQEFGLAHHGAVGFIANNPAQMRAIGTHVMASFADAGQWGLFLTGHPDGRPAGTLWEDNNLYRGMLTWKHKVEWATQQGTPFALLKVYFCTGTPPNARCEGRFLNSVRHFGTPDVVHLATCVEREGENPGTAELGRIRLMRRAETYAQDAYDHEGYTIWYSERELSQYGSLDKKSTRTGTIR